MCDDGRMRKTFAGPRWRFGLVGYVRLDGHVTKKATIPGSGQPFNPFSVHRVEPGALPYVGEGEASLDAILCRLIVLGMRGQITGPHGAGKTTLLVHLHRRAAELGWEVSMFRARRERVVWPKGERTGETPVPRLMFIDSAEQMPRWAWAWLKRSAAVRGVGLVVTTHRDLGLPPLHRREVDAACAKQIVEMLSDSERAEQPALAELGSMLKTTHGSMRDVLFALYDRYEGRRVKN